MDDIKTGSEYMEWQLQMKRRDLIKVQLEKRIMQMIREIVCEKLSQIEPIIEELEAMDKIMKERPPEVKS